ncbi:hypothetical protein RR48_11991 [Papilio machaon]|uniref:Uncharacterized protein n=1 Tax=Papilio machaon TaxID=76193 RepID=A0A194RJY6_PAPMA|nr:hypothetical protein RR48_11991 [Papilio machaon]
MQTSYKRMRAVCRHSRSRCQLRGRRMWRHSDLPHAKGWLLFTAHAIATVSCSLSLLITAVGSIKPLAARRVPSVFHEVFEWLTTTSCHLYTELSRAFFGISTLAQRPPLVLTACTLYISTSAALSAGLCNNCPRFFHCRQLLPAARLQQAAILPASHPRSMAIARGSGPPEASARGSSTAVRYTSRSTSTATARGSTTVSNYCPRLDHRQQLLPAARPPLAETARGSTTVSSYCPRLDHRQQLLPAARPPSAATARGSTTVSTYCSRLVSAGCYCSRPNHCR